MKKLFTTEVVLSGHPDKMCDLIADNILEAYLREDKESRVACEVVASKNRILIMGEVTSKAKVDVESIARKVITDIGYDNDELGFNGNTIPIIIDLNKQSGDIAMGVNKEDIGAGDQGIMYGYATDESDNYMPLVHNIACKLARDIDNARKKNVLTDLRPDGKLQVTIEDNADKKRIDTIIVSVQHNENKNIDNLRQEITLFVREHVPSNLIDNNTKFLVNPTGRFVIGGPVGDSGLTGRKIIVDTYGGIAHHGGGAFSGKDYTKVDRSAAYYARYVAKNIVASGIASKCEVKVAYAIGVSKPVDISINTLGTNKIEEDKILNIVREVFDFRPSNIIEKLNLKNVRYSDTTLYSHFGKDNLPWEKLDKVEILKSLINK